MSFELTAQRLEQTCFVLFLVVLNDSARLHADFTRAPVRSASSNLGPASQQASAVLAPGRTG